MCTHVLRVKSGRSLVRRQAFVQSALAMQCIAEVGMESRDSGVDGNCSAEERCGDAAPANLRVDQSQQVQRLSMPWIHAEDFPIRSFGSIDPTRLLMRHPLGKESLRIKSRRGW